MKVILLKDVKNVGKKFDVKDVASGHALNLLIPRGEATPATPGALKHLHAQKAQTEGERRVQEELLAKNIKDLDGKTLKVAVKANDKGHLFAGMHKEAVIAEVKKQTQLDIDPSFIDMEHPLKEVGSHVIAVKGGNKTAKFTLVVEAL